MGRMAEDASAGVSATLRNASADLHASMQHLESVRTLEVNIAAMTAAAVSEAEEAAQRRNDAAARAEAGCADIVHAARLDPSQRPPSILDAVRFKFEDARRHSGWEMDSAVNYVFADTEASQVVRTLCQGGGTLAVLDVGSGKGDFLVEVEQIATAEGLGVYLRGVTAGYECTETTVERGACCPYGDAEAGDANLPLKVYHQFPAEDIASCHEADFISEGRRFDLIVASWTMLHLADPLGTLVQLYGLLGHRGVLLVNFCYAHIGDGEKERVLEATRILVAAGHLVWLGMEDDTVCLVKGSHTALDLPVNYTHGTVGHVWKTVQPQYCVAHYEFASTDADNAARVDVLRSHKSSLPPLLEFIRHHAAS